MNVFLAAVVLCAVGQASPFEIQAVLEWNLTEPSPLPAEQIERIVAAALSADVAQPDAIRHKLLLRRGITRSNGPSVQWKGAVSDLMECQKLHPNDVFAESNRIAAQAKSGSYAVTPGGEFPLHIEAEALVKKHPESPYPRWALAILLDQYRPTDFGQILQLLNECNRLDPNFGDAHGSKGYVYWILHDYVACLESIKQARACPLADDPRFRITLNFYEALALIEQGRSATALPLLIEVVELVPDRAIPRLQLWLCLSALGRAASAEVVADETLTRFPKFGEGYVAKAISLSLRGEHEAAREVADKLRQLPGKEADFFLKFWCLGRLAENEAKTASAVRLYEQAEVELSKNRGVTAFVVDNRLRLSLLRAAATDQKGRDGRAAVRLSRLLVEELADSPVRNLAQLILACGYAEKGDFDEAIATVDEVASTPGLSPKIRQQCNQLKRLFEGKSPYRLNERNPDDRIIEIPAIACFVGPLKKIIPKMDVEIPVPAE